MNLSRLFFRFGVIFMIASIAADPINTALLELGSILALMGAILPVVGLGLDQLIEDQEHTDYIDPIAGANRFVVDQPARDLDRDRDVVDLNSSLKALEERLDDYQIDRDEIREGDS